MGFFDPAIDVPKVIFRKFEQLVEEVAYIEAGREVDAQERRDLAKQLCVRVLEEYVDQHFRESTRSAAEMFLNRKRMERIL
ncbi:MAG: hypothetical protein K6T83_09365 [Alicyclobacillus sp.]|nr:hypothetical protein [Alicyclobacillus sp.]